jgi:hypothetical protein
MTGGGVHCRRSIPDEHDATLSRRVLTISRSHGRISIAQTYGRQACRMFAVLNYHRTANIHWIAKLWRDHDGGKWAGPGCARLLAVLIGDSEQ